MGSVKKGEKYEGYYLLEVFLIGGNLTELCLCMLTLVLNLVLTLGQDKVPVIHHL